MGRKIKLSHEEIEVKAFLEVLGVYAILALVLVGVYYLEPAITGFVTVTKQLNYTDEVDLEFNEDQTYVWDLRNPGNLKSIKISGSTDEEGEAKVYIENNGIKYLIFDSSKLVEKESGILGITGFVVKDDKKGKNDNEMKIEVEGNLNNDQQTILDLLVFDINKTINNVEIEIETDNGSVSKEVKGNITEIQNNLITNLSLSLENSTEKIKIRIESEFEEQEEEVPDTKINETGEKIININLWYGDNEFYDANNDGVEKINGIIDFSVSSSSFNWDADESKLCTRYEIFSVENQESSFACFGNNNCCNFVDLESSRNLWNESLFLSYGSYGSTSNNIIFSQILNVDYNLSPESPYTDIVYSSWNNKTAKFVEGFIQFENVCVDSCVFDGNASSYNLIIEIEDTTLNIDEIIYSIEARVTNKDPVLIKEIENISIIENKNYTLDLTQYFSDEDDDKLIYSYNEMDNVTVRFEENVAYVIPDKDFAGSRFTYITASDSYGQVVSNTFKIEIISQESSIEFLDSNVDQNWTISFSTKGTGNLIISAVDGTYLEMHNDNISTVGDLDILELACGGFEIFNKDNLIENEGLWFILRNNSKVRLADLLQESYPIKSIYVEDYNCDKTGYYTVKKLSKGMNSLEFIFGDEIKIINSDYGIIVESFEIRDEEDNKLAIFDSKGNAKIKGNLMENILADENDFIIKNGDSSLNLVVTNPEGNLQIKGSLNENRSELSHGNNSFVIKDKYGDVVSYIDSGGSLFLSGTLTESVSFE